MSKGDRVACWTGQAQGRGQKRSLWSLTPTCVIDGCSTRQAIMRHDVYIHGRIHNGRPPIPPLGHEVLSKYPYRDTNGVEKGCPFPAHATWPCDQKRVISHLGSANTPRPSLFCGTAHHWGPGGLGPAFLARFPPISRVKCRHEERSQSKRRGGCSSMALHFPAAVTRSWTP